MSWPKGYSNMFRINTDVAVAGTWDGTATNLSMKAAVPGTKLYITDVTVMQGATALEFKLLNGSGGTVLFKSIQALNTGMSYIFKTPIPLSTNTALCLTSAGGSVGAMVLVGGFVG